MKSQLKLKNLKGLSTVSEKVEINIEANKFKEPDEKGKISGQAIQKNEGEVAQ